METSPSASFDKTYTDIRTNINDVQTKTNDLKQSFKSEIDTAISSLRGKLEELKTSEPTKSGYAGFKAKLSKNSQIKDLNKKILNLEKLNSKIDKSSMDTVKQMEVLSQNVFKEISKQTGDSCETQRLSTETDIRTIRRSFVKAQSKLNYQLYTIKNKTESKIKKITLFKMKRAIAPPIDSLRITKLDLLNEKALKLRPSVLGPTT